MFRNISVYIQCRCGSQPFSPNKTILYEIPDPKSLIISSVSLNFVSLVFYLNFFHSLFWWEESQTKRRWCEWYETESTDSISNVSQPLLFLIQFPAQDKSTNRAHKLFFAFLFNLYRKLNGETHKKLNEYFGQMCDYFLQQLQPNVQPIR